MGTLTGKVAFVTGGGRGLGRACALELAGRGAHVGLGARSAEEVEAVAREVAVLGVKSLGVTVDVTSEESVRAAVARVEKELGPIDVLLCNAGIAPSAPFEKTDSELWRRTFAVNVDGTYFAMRAVLPGMTKRGFGRVINMASVAGKVGFPYVSAYCASKHAVIGLTRTVALEVAKKGVTVNAVCPGYVDTKMTRDAVERIQSKTGLSQKEARGHLEQASPQGRMVGEDEVARLVAFLAEPGQLGINGQAINLDGGGVTA
ncbi:MAG TPA: SDR family NAD(P)-dependent oxidoreductase [Planctomycetota bacterium]|nr:SDR family NAD(P)-dependent oxidoreductase [Planctomycetota bacterium]